MGVVLGRFWDRENSAPYTYPYNILNHFSMSITYLSPYVWRSLLKTSRFYWSKDKMFIDIYAKYLSCMWYIGWVIKSSLLFLKVRCCSEHKNLPQNHLRGRSEIRLRLRLREPFFFHKTSLFSRFFNVSRQINILLIWLILVSLCTWFQNFVPWIFIGSGPFWDRQITLNAEETSDSRSRA